MVLSLIIGLVGVFLGALCVIAAIVVGVVEVIRPKAGLEGVPIAKLLTLIKGIIEAIGKLKPAGQFLVIGTGLLVLGTYLLYTRPF